MRTNVCIRLERSGQGCLKYAREARGGAAAAAAMAPSARTKVTPRELTVCGHTHTTDALGAILLAGPPRGVDLRDGSSTPFGIVDSTLPRNTLVAPQLAQCSAARSRSRSLCLPRGVLFVRRRAVNDRSHIILFHRTQNKDKNTPRFRHSTENSPRFASQKRWPRRTTRR